MNPLQRRLASLRYRMRLFIGWRGLCAVLAIVIGAGVLIGLVDWLVYLPSLIRALFLVGILGVAGFVFYRHLYLPISSRCDDLSLALRIEAHYPELNDALASTVQFLEATEDSPGSVALRKKAIEQTFERTEHIDFGGILDRRGGLWITVAALATIATAGHFLYHHADFSAIAIQRLADPFGNHTWTQIDLVDCPNMVAQGRPFPLRGNVEGVIPKVGLLEIDDGKHQKSRPIDIKVDPKTGQGTLVTGIDMTQQLGRFKFRIRAGDGAFPPGRNAWHAVDVLQPPSFANLNGHDSPQIELRPPAYTDLPPLEKLAPGIKYIRAVAGTHVTFRAAADRRLEDAWIEFRPENPLVRTAAQLSAIGIRDTLGAAGSLSLGGAVWNRVPARFLDGDRKIFAIDFIPPATGEYHFEMRENVFLARDFNAVLQVYADPLPVVQIQRPATSMDVVADAEILVKFAVEDDIFAVRSAFLEYRRKNAEGHWLEAQPRRIPLYDHRALGMLLPRLSAQFAGSLWAAPDLRLRPKKLELTYRWALKKEFANGDTVSVQACAEDFCDIDPGRPPGRSSAIELRIVTRAEIANMLDKGLGDAQRDLVRLQQMQENALNLVKEIKARNDKGEITQREIEQLIVAEQTQRAMQERIGQRPDEGLRAELAKLQQMVKENKLPGSGVQDQIKTLKNELDRLATEELPQIEPNLAEARKELTGAAKPSPKEKGALAKAQQYQEEAKKTLDELGKFLDPWASMNEIKGKTRELLQQQQALTKETAKLEADLKKTENNPKAAGEHRNDLLKKADAQKDLADKAQSLLDQMGKAEEKRGKDGDQDAADKLKTAGKIGRDSMLAKNMREAAEKLNPDSPQIQGALGKQGASAKNLQKMLNALEDKKEDDIDRLAKKRKDAGQNQEAIEKLANDQERLQKKAREANKIADPKERDQELKRLAEEQEKLKEEAQKNARELARLQEEQASQDLNRAAQEMERAAQKMKDGANAEEHQQEALDRLDNAQMKLQEFEDELAREQLAQIAERIKGLKERQDAAQERSKELHKKVMSQKNWGRGLLGTLDGDRLVEEGLATETRSLKEKLKDAIVFEHVFEKSAKAMDQAAAAMSERREAAADRQVGEMEKDEIIDEGKRADETLRLQALASQRLQRLLDALKQEKPDPIAKKEPNGKEPGGEPPGENDQPRMRPGDGVPPMAQLKALRAEQAEINERTKAIGKQNPNPDMLPDTLRRELEEMQAEQQRLHRFFQELTAPGKKGDAP